MDAKAFLARMNKVDARRTTGFVYFVQCEQFVKIGYSEDNPRYRPKVFETGNPFPCTLIGIMPGGMHKEKSLHCEFEDLHHRGEWFRLTPELRARIAELCGDWSRVALGAYVSAGAR